MSNRYFKDDRELINLRPHRLAKLTINFSAHILLRPGFDAGTAAHLIEHALKQHLHNELGDKGIVLVSHLSAMEREPIEVPDP